MAKFHDVPEENPTLRNESQHRFRHIMDLGQDVTVASGNSKPVTAAVLAAVRCVAWRPRLAVQ